MKLMSEHDFDFKKGFFFLGVLKVWLTAVVFLVSHCVAWTLLVFFLLKYSIRFFLIFGNKIFKLIFCSLGAKVAFGKGGVEDEEAENDFKCEFVFEESLF